MAGRFQVASSLHRFALRAVPFKLIGEHAGLPTSEGFE